ncbi:hypothetical protein [Phenylobacterium sp.]|jgi:hypothetical protein|uniref:hypothetical protein n=1 Tax=Phenylobacterium sp. TaxID=1871053 RepID=UPI002F954CF1
MHLTYELYFQEGDEPPKFEALTCASLAELMSAARRRLAERRATSVAVHQFGRELFTLKA